jgi:hypothetical protein
MKLIAQVLSVFLLIGCSTPMEKNKQLLNALNNAEIKIRGTLIEISQTEYRLDYYDVSEQDSHYNFLSSKGYQGGGPNWAGIIYGAIQLSDPTILTKIRFDDEADGLAIWSSDKETLMKIGRLISVIKSDEAILRQAIHVAEQEGEME